MCQGILGKRIYGTPKIGDIIIIDVSMLSPSASRHTDIIFHVYEHAESETPSLSWSGHHFVEQQGQEEDEDRFFFLSFFHPFFSVTNYS